MLDHTFDIKPIKQCIGAYFSVPLIFYVQSSRLDFPFSFFGIECCIISSVCNVVAASAEPWGGTVREEGCVHLT